MKSLSPPAGQAPDERAAQALRVFARFESDAPAMHAVPHGSGHINDTFAVTCRTAQGNPRRYLLQRINSRIFRDVPALMDNIARVTRHARSRLSAQATERVLTLIPDRDGAAFTHDDTGAAWRCYDFIEGARSYDLLERPEQAREAAAAFGRFQGLLADLPAPRLHETIPAFHHTRRRFETFLELVRRDPAGRVALVQDEIAFANAREAMVDRLLDLHARGDLPERTTHNDTKLNNVMLDDATGRAVCVIDLDTVMPGLALYDFGDLVRSATNAAAEDATNLAQVVARPEIFTALTEGYLATARSFLRRAEIAELAFAGRLITFEIGLRFLTDFIEGDVYFKTKRPGHNLDRARNQFALVRSLELQQDSFQRTVDRLAAQP
jgi:Ser/Thr protein kinase RdoA (MazF antagonist)